MPNVNLKLLNHLEKRHDLMEMVFVDVRLVVR